VDAAGLTLPDKALVEAVVTLAPASVLRLIADATIEATEERPQAIVHLRGGQVLEGTALRVGADGGHEVLVLADSESGRLVYALVESVIAVEVRDPELIQDLLTDGRLPPLYTGEPVTRLALQREFGPSPGFPVQIDWEAVGGSEPLLVNLARLLRALRGASARVCIDSMGIQAWEQVRLLRVEHRPAAALSVQREGDRLLVSADLNVALPRDHAEEIYREISTLL
jgi:hypothetical protein